MILFFQNIIGYFLANKWAAYLAGGILLLVIVFSFGYCRGSGNVKPIKIDTEEINKINSANEKERTETLKEIIKRGQDVIDEKQTSDAEVEKKLDEINQKIEDAKKDGENVTAKELEDLLNNL